MLLKDGDSQGELGTNDRLPAGCCSISSLVLFFDVDGVREAPLQHMVLFLVSTESKGFLKSHHNVIIHESCK
jgi:hypothetical protein